MLRVARSIGPRLRAGVMALTLTAAAAEARPSLEPLDAGVTLFRDVTVLTMTDEGALKNHSVLVRDGKIAQVAPAADLKAPEGARVIEGAGRVLMPGLADLHIHLPPFVGEVDDASWRACTLLLANGVTTVRGMQGHPTHVELRRRLVAGTLLGPTAHIAGPPLVAQNTPTPEAAREQVTKQKQSGFDFIKSHRVIKREVFEAIQAAAKEAGVPVAGHVDNEVGLEAALATGMQVEHLDGFFAGILRDTALVGQFGQFPPAGLRVEFDRARVVDLAAKVAAAKAWSGPTMALFRNAALAYEPVELWAERPELRYIARPAKEAWIKQRSQFGHESMFGDPDHSRWFIETRAGMLKALRDAGARLLLCSDSPQVFMVAGFAAHDELAAMVDAGLTPMEALTTGTRHAAEYFDGLPNKGSALGLKPDFGRIATGLRADLLLLREDPTKSIAATRTIDAVMLRGKLLDRAALDGMLKAVEESAKRVG